MQADFYPFEFAKPSALFRFDFSAFEGLDEFFKAGALCQVGAEHGASDTGVFVDAGCSVGSSAASIPEPVIEYLFEQLPTARVSSPVSAEVTKGTKQKRRKHQLGTSARRQDSPGHGRHQSTGKGRAR
ncbi:hypothetical protein ASF98_21490 [Arthrobacter sp. Leaf337]|nr:hypothetical protein ASF98_21490 [Arthrobacter sp. Leaf337]